MPLQYYNIMEQHTINNRANHVEYENVVHYVVSLKFMTPKNNFFFKFLLIF